ncbi:DmsC/YnfH family molybdoenzyme membrane anchor subunit [Bacteroidota bacterium]
MQKSFLFDINKCTGCQACTIACSTENYKIQEINWRDVHVYNEIHIPELPYFNLSLACNHCMEPACLLACPTRAYTKDTETGAVLVNQDYCMGCKYCTWACPYDAPKYNQKTKVIEKCTFCNDRLKSGKDPACVVACPTGSLQLTELQTNDVGQNIQGFTNSNLEPAISFIPLREGYRFPEMIESTILNDFPDLFELSSSRSQNKISLRSEWSLVFFTSIIAVLISWFTAHIVKSVFIDPWVFLGLGGIALLFSSLHLGNKLRAYRAILNFKSSWLSREIVFVSAFLFFAGAHLISNQITEYARWAAIVSGFAGLYSIDMLYRVALTKIPLQLHSASTFLTALFLFGIFTLSPTIILTFGIIKLALYVYRKINFYKNNHSTLPIVSAFRILFGILFPVIIILVSSEIPGSLSIYIIIAVIIGEVIDRCEFYNELEILTPKKQISLDLEKELKK